MEELLRVENLSYAYPDGQQALKDINLTVYKGDSLALVGPNGAGKSTLILHFNGIIRGDGNVSFLGQPIDDKNLKQVRSRVGLVFQNPDDQLFSPTVFDDVAFGPINMGYDEAQVNDAVTKALELVGMSGFEKRSPHHLSIGEKKRIAIATVLSMSPDLLVIDEPSSSLDPKGKWDFIDFLKHLSWTKIIVSHDLELVESLCKRIVVMQKGSIVADGLTADILSDKKLLVKYGLARPERQL
ncbi:MAG: ABC transporter ATP-binding protein [Dehalococcoidales bacterium]|nr:ABC transporter ATP-binding protein [Dehalococcoidales bacterium]